VVEEVPPALRRDDRRLPRLPPAHPLPVPRLVRARPQPEPQPLAPPRVHHGHHLRHDQRRVEEEPG